MFLKSVATEQGAQSRLDDIIDSVVRDVVSSNSRVELVRSSSWETPEEEVLEEAPQEVVEELQKEIRFGREQITRGILREAQKITPQYGIEVVDVRIKRLNYVESVREKVYDRFITTAKWSRRVPACARAVSPLCEAAYLNLPNLNWAHS